MRKICKILVLTLSLFIVFSPIASAESTDDWGHYFFLSEDGRDMSLLWKDYLQYEEGNPEYGLAFTLAQHNNAQLNFEQAFVLWEFNNLGWERYKKYTNFTDYYADNRNFDELPAYMEERYIILPAYSADELKVGVEFWNIYPELDKRPIPSEPVGGFLALYELWGEYDASLVQKIFEGAEAAYNAVKAKGTKIKKIVAGRGWSIIQGGKDLDFVLMVTVEDECGGYVYVPANDNLYTFAEFSERLENNNWPSTPTPTPTRTPFWTPRPSTASTIKPSSNTTAAPSKTAAVSPSHAETASPELWASPSSWQKPSASYEPEQTGGSAAVIVLAAAAGCVLIGGIVWAIVSARKKKP